MHKFIDELRGARLELGLSRRQVQKDVGISRNYLTEVEKGQYNLSIRYGIILCDYYGIDINLFIDYKNHMLLNEIEAVSKELEISV